MDESEIIRVLISSGLKRNEILVYLDLIRKGKSSPTQISRRTGVYRSNTYGALNRLIQKGIVNQTINNNKKLFYPVNPDALFDFHKNQGEELKKIIPEIQKMQNIQNEETKVTTSQGAKSVKNILLELLELKEPLYIYGTPKEAYETMGGFFDGFHKLRVEKQIELKRIYGRESIHRMNNLNKIPYTEARYLPLYNSKTSTNICKNNVIIILWDFPIEIISIDNKHIAKAYKNNFLMLWQEAKQDI